MRPNETTEMPVQQPRYPVYRRYMGIRRPEFRQNERKTPYCGLKHRSRSEGRTPTMRDALRLTKETIKEKEIRKRDTPTTKIPSQEKPPSQSLYQDLPPSTTH